MNSTNKKELRRLVRAREAGVDRVRCGEWSRRVEAIVEGLEVFREARTVALYSALPGEVSMAGVMERWHREKRILLPVVRGEEMDFVRYEWPGALRQGAFGIWEPAGGEVVPAADIDLIVVPGVAFSACGERLGRGRGFYDRFLAGTRAYKIGVCFDHQVVEGIACDPHDVNMDMIITPSGVKFS